MDHCKNIWLPTESWWVNRRSCADGICFKNHLRQHQTSTCLFMIVYVCFLRWVSSWGGLEKPGRYTDSARQSRRSRIIGVLVWDRVSWLHHFAICLMVLFCSVYWFVFAGWYLFKPPIWWIANNSEVVPWARRMAISTHWNDFSRYQPSLRIHTPP